MRIYITYCWDDEKIADTLDYYFQQVGIKLIRDKRDLNYSSSIEDFARKMRRGSFDICLISDVYLKRINCMHEISQLLKDDNFATKKFCPIIVDTSTKKVDLTPEGIEVYASFWKNKLEEQNKLIDNISENSHKLEQIRELKKQEVIYNNIREFLYLLKDVKYITVSEIEKNGILAIGQSIFKKIGVSPQINLEELYNITQLSSVEEAEIKLAEYASKHLIKENEYYLYTKAVVYEKNGYYDLALYNYSLAYRIEKNFVLAYEAIILLYLRGIYKIDDRFENTVTGLNIIDGNNPLIDIASGLLAMREQNYKRAVNLFEQVIWRDTISLHREYVYNNLANAYEKLYENEHRQELLSSAEKYYRMAIEENPQYYQTLNNLSLLYLMKLSDLSNAQNAITKCLSICPNYHMGLNTQGLIYEEKQEFEKALECYMRSYEYSKFYSPPLNQIGRILDYEYHNSLCKLYYELSYEINPNSLVNCFNLGNFYRKYTNDLETARRLLERAISIDGSNILCYMAMGLLKYKNEDYLSARDYFSYAFASDQDYAPGCFCLAMTEYKIRSDSSRARILIDSFLEKHSSPYLEQISSAFESVASDLEEQIICIFKTTIEYEYVNTSGQIWKSLTLNPVTDIHDAYQYIIDNFYQVNSDRG